jgi:hypothetical protein
MDDVEDVVLNYTFFKYASSPPLFSAFDLPDLSLRSFILDLPISRFSPSPSPSQGSSQPEGPLRSGRASSGRRRGFGMGRHRDGRHGQGEGLGAGRSEMNAIFAEKKHFAF